MIGAYPVAHLIGRTDLENEALFRKAERELTLQGYIVFCPVIYDRETKLENVQDLNDMCYSKLLMADIVVLVGGPVNVGRSTSHRLGQAFTTDKPVFLWRDNKLYSKIGSFSELRALADQYTKSEVQW